MNTPYGNNLSSYIASFSSSPPPHCHYQLPLFLSAPLYILHPAPYLSQHPRRPISAIIVSIARPAKECDVTVPKFGPEHESNPLHGNAKFLQPLNVSLNNLTIFSFDSQAKSSIRIILWLSNTLFNSFILILILWSNTY